MNRALILYHSRTGTTAAYSNEIASKLSEIGIETKVLPMYQASTAPVSESEIVFLGCWTSGLMVIGQKPEKIWREYLRQLPPLQGKEIILFTTYKILTGSMFRKMEQCLPADTRVNIVRLKSRNGKLTDSDMQFLNSLFPICQTQNQ